MRVANLNKRLASLGYEVEDLGNIAVDQPEASPEGLARAHYLTQIARLCERLGLAVEGAASEGKVPLVLGGDHSIAIGTVAGMSSTLKEEQSSADLDRRMPYEHAGYQSSGNIHGMPLACCVGMGPPELTGLFGSRPRLLRETLHWSASATSISGKRHWRESAFARTVRHIDERGPDRSWKSHRDRLERYGRFHPARHGLRRSTRRQASCRRGTYRDALAKMICDR
jgi:arginase